jgi:hypothetical protein
MSSARVRVEASHEWLAHDPLGGPRPADVSFRVLVRGQGEYRLSASMGDVAAAAEFSALDPNDDILAPAWS